MTVESDKLQALRKELAQAGAEVAEESNLARDMRQEMEAAMVNGDLFDEDSNDSLGQIELVNGTLPAQLSIYLNGFLYVYKIDRRYGYETESKELVIQKKDQYSDL